MNKELKCKCGTVVARGELVLNKKHREVFIPDNFSYPKVKGTIIRNGSRNYKKWTILCSSCQKEKCKEVTNDE